MQPASPSIISPARGAGSVTLRGVFALLLALLLAAVVDAQPTAPVAAQPSKKETDKKDPDKKDPVKPPEVKWPTDINGKDIKAVMEDMGHLDPTIREFAARTLPNFGPPAQKGEVSKLLLKRMNVERDPTVRFAVWNAVGAIPFDNEDDNTEALRLLINVIDTGASGGSSRYQAVQTVSMFGPRASGAITALTGVAASDASYETRRTIASTLGRVGFNETTGPNMKALSSLADRFARDESAAVRMESLQALMLLGPPWDGVKKAGMMMPPPINTKSAEVIVKYMKARVGDPKMKREGLEKDKQVEIWARLVLMRFDPKEVNEENLDAFARHLTGIEVGVKVQALQAIALMGETAGKKVNAVANLLSEKDQPIQLTLVTVQTLAAMGAGAKPAIPELKKLADEMKKTIDKMKDEERKMALDLIKLKDQEKKDADNALKGKENDRKTGEEIVKLIESVIKHIDEAKPISPSSGSGDPSKKP